MTRFNLEIKQFLGGDWQKLIELEMKDSVVTLEAAVTNVGNLSEVLLQKGSMFFTKDDGESLLLSLEHGPISMRPVYR